MFVLDVNLNRDRKLHRSKGLIQHSYRTIQSDYWTCFQDDGQNSWSAMKVAVNLLRMLCVQYVFGLKSSNLNIVNI